MLEQSNNKNTQCLKNAIAQDIDFETSIKELLNCRSEYELELYIRKLFKMGLIPLDDYSIAIMH